MSEQPMHRETAHYMLTSVWNLSRQKTIDLIDNACLSLQQRHRDRLQNSFQDFERIIENVLSNREYVRNEQAHIFGYTISELIKVFKGTLNALIAEMPGRNLIRGNPSQPWNMLAVLLNDEDYSYPSVTTLITYLRNVDQHAQDDIEVNLPIDHITGIETCGNIYTLVSILILSIYALIDILQAV